MALDLTSVNNPNTGAAAGDVSRATPRFLIIGTREFTAAEFASDATLQAALKAATLKGRGQSGKLVVFPLIMNVENATEADKKGTLNQGFSETLVEGAPAFNFGLRISNRHAQILRGYNGQEVFAYTVDSNKNMWATALDSGNIRGEQVKLFVGGDNFTDGQNSKTVPFGVAWLNVEEFKDYSKCVKLGFNAAQYGQLKDVTLVEAAAFNAATGVAKVQAVIKTGIAGKDLNVYDDFAALSNKANWSVVRLDTGAAITITSVGADAAAKNFTITPDAAIFGALPAGTLVAYNFADPATLDAAGIKGVEGVQIVYAKA